MFTPNQEIVIHFIGGAMLGLLHATPGISDGIKLLMMLSMFSILFHRTIGINFTVGVLVGIVHNSTEMSFLSKALTFLLTFLFMIRLAY